MSAHSFILIGGGGHAKVVYDAITASGGVVTAYTDPKPSSWLEDVGLPRLTDEALDKALCDSQALALSFVGLDCPSLERRYALMVRYGTKASFPAIIHPSAVVSPWAKLSPGVQVMAGAIINAYAHIGAGAIINTRAVIEHDAHIGEGVHIAPGAVVLGAARVGEASYIGSNAVIVQNVTVKAKTFVKAASVVTLQS